jgi:hypothetical protein
MSNYKLKPGLTSVFLPGAGKVTTKTVLTGEQYQRFVPQFLVEAPETSPVTGGAVSPPPVAVPTLTPAVAPVPVAEATPERTPELVVVTAPEADAAPEPVSEPVVAPSPITETLPEPVVPEVLQEVVPAPAAVLDSPEVSATAIVGGTPSAPVRPAERKKRR